MGSRMNTLPERKLSIIYGGEVVDFEVLESPSRTEKILIKVYADCRVVVSTPLNTDDKTIIEAVSSVVVGSINNYESSVNKVDLSRLANIKVVKATFI